jgi:hypothetical protein
MIGWIGLVSHHSRPLLHAIELTVLFCVHSYAEWDGLMLKLRRLYCMNREFDLLASYGKHNHKKSNHKMTCIPHRFLYSIL